MTLRRPPVAVVVALAMAATATGADPAARSFDEQVRPLLARNCLDCHGPDKAKGGFRADRLTADLTDPANRERWLTAARRVRAGEMPPKKAPAEVARLAEWADAAEATRRAAHGRV